MQYTIRNIPAEVDQALREQAAVDQKSLNNTLIEALRRGLGLGKRPEKQRDLSAIFGKKLMDKATLEALEEQNRIDPEDWD